MPGPDPRPTTARPIRDGISIGVAIGVVGVAFGVLAAGAGLSPAKAVTMSLLVFTGASQFAVVSVVAAGGSIAAALGSAALLALRNGLYGPVVARWFEGTPTSSGLALSQLIIDESTAVGAAQREPADQRRGFLAGGFGVFVFWAAGTLAGALGGSALGGPERWGLDAAFPAAMVALLWPHLAFRPGRVVALAAALVTVATLPVLPAGVPILLAAVCVVPVSRWSRRHQETSE